MNSLKGKKIDEYFRQELTRQEQPFEEYHWLVLEKRLRKNRRRRVVGWFITTGLAAMLLVALGISFLLNQKAETPVQTAQKIPAKVPSVNADRPEGIRSGSPEASPEAAGPAGVNFTRADRRTGSDAPVNLRTVQALPAGRLPAALMTPAGHFVVSQEALPSDQPVIGLPAAGELRADRLAFSQPGGDGKRNRPEEEAPAKKEPFRGSLTLSVFGGPDINGVNNLRSTGKGSSAGIALTYNVLPRLSITAGAAYAKKLYSTDFSNYRPNTSYTFPTNPSMVDADCRVLDLPINLNYTVWQKKSNAIGISAGMSSYIMLREDYRYDYPYGGSQGPDHYGVSNKNRHYLGVMNFGAEYRKQVGRDLSIGVSPYVKLPVTDIGYGNVKLESAGITTSLNFNLRGLKSDKK